MSPRKNTRLRMLLRTTSFLSLAVAVACYQTASSPPTPPLNDNPNQNNHSRHRPASSSSTQQEQAQQQPSSPPHYRQPNSERISFRSLFPRPAKNEPSIMKAWHCHGRTQRDLVERLRQARIVKSTAVQQTMEQVDRQYYIGESNLKSGVNPYLDTPQGIDKSQTISAPHMHAHVLEEILPALVQKNQQTTAATSSTTKDADEATTQQQDSKNINKESDPVVKVLDVGCGSGYLTACLGRWFKSKESGNEPSSPTTTILPFSGAVFGMDIHPELVDFTKQNIQRHDGDLLSSGTVTLRHGNGWRGWPEEAPFDAIHVGAAAEAFPAALANQLAVHGILIVPVGPTGNVQTLLKVERIAQSSSSKTEQDFVWEDFQVTQLLGVRYVPLVQRPE